MEAGKGPFQYFFLINLNKIVICNLLYQISDLLYQISYLLLQISHLLYSVAQEN